MSVRMTYGIVIYELDDLKDNRFACFHPQEESLLTAFLRKDISGLMKSKSYLVVQDQ